MRWVGLLLVGCAWTGCAPESSAFYTERRPVTGDPDGDGGDGGMEDPSSVPDLSGITIDTSSTDPYVMGFPATWPISGWATADQGLDRVEIDGIRAPVDPTGEFRADVSVSPGLRVVPITA